MVGLADTTTWPVNPFVYYHVSFFVWVGIDGRRAPEHEVEVSRQKIPSLSGIPSEEGKTYLEVCWKGDSRRCQAVSIYGRKRGLGHIAPTGWAKLLRRTLSDMTEPFLFSRLNITDDEDTVWSQALLLSQY
uniref:Uncharacterized protein n=1 Tax=Moniliophthora roreri TaxID=221103 RepID=A0A0W0F9U6_MONRR